MGTKTSSSTLSDQENWLGKQLWLNDGGDFTMVSNNPFGTTGQVSCAAFADVDGDGDLDLFVGKMSSCDYFSCGPASSELWLNDGSGGFTAATGGPTAGTSSATTVAFADVDADGDVDLFVGFSGRANELWLNDGSGGFMAVSGGPTESSSITSESTSSWSPTFDRIYEPVYLNTLTAAFGDADGDGDIDLFLGHEYPTAMLDVNGNALPLSFSTELWVNTGNGTFTAATGVGGTATARVAAWGDADGDGDLDLLVGGAGYSELWLNNGLGNFTAATGRPGGSTLSMSTAVWFDANGDGNLDLFVGNDNANANELWLGVRDSGFSARVCDVVQTAGSVLLSVLHSSWADVTGARIEPATVQPPRPAPSVL